MAHDKSCLMANLPFDVANDLRQFAFKIPDEDIYSDSSGDYGRTDSPHVTVVYGLSDNDPSALREFLRKEKPIELKLKDVRHFSRKNKPYDVLYVSVESESLKKLRNKVLKKFPAEIEFKEYKPHATIAYLKKGRAKKYLGDTRFRSRDKVVIPVLDFSSHTVDFHSLIPLAKEARDSLAQRVLWITHGAKIA